MTKKKEQAAVDDSGKMTIKFTENAPATNPLVGNIYEGKVSILNKQTAKRFIELGYAKQVDAGTKGKAEPTAAERAKKADAVAKKAEAEAAKAREAEAKDIAKQEKAKAKTSAKKKK